MPKKTQSRREKIDALSVVNEAWATWVTEQIHQQLSDEGVTDIDSTEFLEVCEFILTGVANANTARMALPPSSEENKP